VLETSHHFTLESANAFVPRLAEMFAEIRADVEALRGLARELSEAGFPLPDDGPVQVDAAAPTRVQQRQEEAHALAERIGEALDGVAQMGVEVKGIDGLVDFRTRRGDEVVYLCWRFGEAAVTHWHPLESGFAGRRPIRPTDVFEGDRPQ
jgi:hypothetical protein